MQIVVNISDAKASSTPTDQLVTYSLGSCIGVAMYDAASNIAGLLHFQLPTSTLDVGRAKENPTMFADTGVEMLLQKMQALGADPKGLKVKIAGGAKMLGDSTTFDIGKRNHQAIRKLLWQKGIFIEAEDCGGTAPRTVYLDVADGSVTMKRQGETVKL